MARPPAIEKETALWFALNIQSVGLTDDQFLQLCRDNEDLRFEVSAVGELIVMAPTSPHTDEKNVTITTALRIWTKQDGAGVSFGSSAMFTLPNGAKRSPDAAWIPKKRWNRLTEKERKSLTRICPDFVVELRSVSDRLSKLKAKLEEYVANGAQLVWLLDPIDNRATIYRPGGPPESIDQPAIFRGDPVLPGFTFDFREIL